MAATIIIVAVVAGLLFLAVRKLVKDHKQGGACAGCGGCGGCHPKGGCGHAHGGGGSGPGK